jgi:hypothetical protein
MVKKIRMKQKKKFFRERKRANEMCARENSSSRKVFHSMRRSRREESYE